MFDLPLRLCRLENNSFYDSVKIILHWGKTNIHRELGRLVYP